MKNLRLLVCAVVLFSCFSLHAGDSAASPWSIASATNLTLTLNSYSDNWTGGEVGTITWTAQNFTDAQRQLAPWALNKNSLKLAFGQTHTQDPETENWAPPRKSNDLIDLKSAIQYTLGGFVDPFTSVRLVSQFLDAGDTLEDRYLTPVTATESFGVVRQLLKRDSLSWESSLGGAFRQVIFHDKLSGGEQETDITSDGGLELISAFTARPADGWYRVSSTVTLYQPLLSTASDEGGDDWRYPHMDWENNLSLVVSRYIMVNVYLQLLYDKELDENVRFKETLSAGLTYTFER